ncbi:MAG: hypothetical protein JWP88_621, partial [Flaviaesturariibacter sp.]|nr:hypothetical protein [Flaviaesturariibacter sp.]
PKNILPPEQMQKVLWDIIRADEWVNFQAQTDSTLKRLPQSAALYQNVLQEHHTTENNFKVSFKYYEKHPELMKIVLDSIQAQASRKPIPSVKKTES